MNEMEVFLPKLDINSSYLDNKFPFNEDGFQNIHEQSLL